MKKILLVEDEESFGTILKETLHDQGFEVQLLREGGSAVFAAVKNFQPNLILLDQLLPKMNGLDILKELKNNPESKNIPVIMLSSLDHDEDIKKPLAAGAVDYFAKAQHPLNEITEKIKHFLMTA